MKQNICQKPFDVKRDNVLHLQNILVKEMFEETITEITEEIQI